MVRERKEKKKLDLEVMWSWTHNGFVCFSNRPYLWHNMLLLCYCCFPAFLIFSVLFQPIYYAFLKLLILDVILHNINPLSPKSLICILTLSSSEASSSRLFRAFSTLAKRPDRDSRRLTTLSRSPTNIRNFRVH